MPTQDEPEDRIARRGVTAASILLLLLAIAGLVRELNRPAATSPLERGGAQASVERRIDINTAPVHLLQTLPGVGPRLAQRIIASREADGPFASVSDLQRVKGIGTRTVARLAAVAYASDGTEPGGE